jgi:hypothetical protein
MDSLLNKYFGPLGKEYCVYFYALSVLFGISFMLSLLSIFYFFIFNYKKVNSTFVANSVFILLNTFFAYFVNRLLHGMCVKSV